VTLAFYTVATFGLAYIVGFSKISFPTREWMANWKVLEWPLALLECPACLGFWAGLVYGLAITEPPLSALGRGLYTCGANFLLAKWSGLIQEEA
jgi:predicted ABC-type sugar transport system permease subunit